MAERGAGLKEKIWFGGRLMEPPEGSDVIGRLYLWKLGKKMQGIAISYSRARAFCMECCSENLRSLVRYVQGFSNKSDKWIWSTKLVNYPVHVVRLILLHSTGSNLSRMSTSWLDFGLHHVAVRGRRMVAGGEKGCFVVPSQSSLVWDFRV